jgi:DUF1680 family protein
MNATAGHAPLTDTRRSPHAILSGVGLTDVKWTSGFWADRFRHTADVSVPTMGTLFQETERVKYLGNFEVAAGLVEGRYRGPTWNDGDYYKWLEAVAAVYAIHHDPKLDRLMDESIALIARVQSPEGYIHTRVLIGEKTENPPKRFAEPLHFEMYNMGHLLTAACVHHRATGKSNFLEVAIKVADFLDKHYANPTSEHARHGVCPSHLMGLVELYRTTRDAKHLRTAERLVEMRERVVKGDDDNQDRIPIRQHTTAHGHAVRATYLYAGVADIVAENGDQTLLKPLMLVWDDLVRTKLYITGGCGALFDGASPDASEDQANITRVHQAFGRSYQLPMASAHNETCAAVGNAMWNWRMLLLTGDPKFADLLEWTLLNSVLVGVNLEGDKYFYTNALRRTADEPLKLRMHRERQAFFSWFCCPPNAVRMLAESTSYAYAMAKDSVTTVVYGSNELATTLDNGTVIRLTQATDYPWDGRVTITVNESTGPAWTLRVRVPGWAKSAKVLINGKEVGTAATPGTFIELIRDWSAGDVVTLDLPMPVRFVEANQHVEEARNHVAVTRGPVVYCLESPDLPAGVKLPDVAVPLTADLSPATGSGELAGIGVLSGSLISRAEKPWTNELYREAEPTPATPVDVRLIPYFAWGNRGKTEMSVWLPRAG